MSDLGMALSNPEWSAKRLAQRMKEGEAWARSLGLVRPSKDFWMYVLRYGVPPPIGTEGTASSPEQDDLRQKTGYSEPIPQLSPLWRSETPK